MFYRIVTMFYLEQGGMRLFAFVYLSDAWKSIISILHGHLKAYLKF